MGIKLIVGTDTAPPYFVKRGSLAINWNIGQRANGNVTLVDESGSLALLPIPAGKPCQVKDGTTPILWGTLDDLTWRNLRAGTSAGIDVSRGGIALAADCTLVGAERLLDKRLIPFALYDSKTCKQIIEDLAPTYLTPEGVTLADIQDGATVTSIIFEYSTVADALQSLADLSNYAVYIDAGKGLHFVPKNTYSAPFDVDDTTSGVRNVRRRVTREDYCNRRYFRMSSDVRPVQSHDFIGDGSSKSWTQALPIDELSHVLVNGTDKSFGYLGDTGRDFYYERGSGALTEDASGPVYTSSDTISIQFYAVNSNVLQAQNDTAISDRISVEGGTGVYEALDGDSGETSSDSAAARLNAALAIYSRLPQEVTYETWRHGLLPGMVQHIEQTIPPISGDFFITAVRFQDAPGHAFSYSVKAVDAGHIPGAWGFFHALSGGSVSSGGSVTATPGAGGSGGGLGTVALYIAATVGIESDAALPVYLNRSGTASGVSAYLKTAPAGADLVLSVTVGGATWASVTVPAGSTSATISGAGLGVIPPGTSIGLSVTAVGSTFPGSDLAVFIYF